MYSRWFNVAVVMLWVSAMSWLVSEKVLPPLLVGEPPNYQTILWAQEREPTVGWKLLFDRQELGWALSTTSRLPSGMTEVESRVHFDEFPLQQITPGWLRALLDLGTRPATGPQLDTESRLTIDSFGRLTQFVSEARLGRLQETIKVDGTIDGRRLRMVVRWQDSSTPIETYLPDDALLDDALSPQTYLPGLRKGQTWTVPVCNPLLLQQNELEVLQATVERTEPIVWGGRVQETWLVVYRRDPGSGLGSSGRPRGRLWVRRDGTVLKQEVSLLGSVMTFRRLSSDELKRLEHQVGNTRNTPP